MTPPLRELGDGVYAWLAPTPQPGATNAGVVVDDDGITIITVDRSEPGPRRLAYADIERARTVFLWESTPKPGKGGAKKAAAGASTYGKAVS